MENQSNVQKQKHTGTYFHVQYLFNKFVANVIFTAMIAFTVLDRLDRQTNNSINQKNTYLRFRLVFTFILELSTFSLNI